MGCSVFDTLVPRCCPWHEPQEVLNHSVCSMHMTLRLCAALMCCGSETQSSECSLQHALRRVLSTTEHCAWYPYECRPRYC